MKHRRVIWTERAELALAETVAWIAADNVVAAERWMRRVLERVNRLDTMPDRGRVVPELGRADVRELIISNYRIVYRVQPDQVEVLLIMEGHHWLPDDIG